MSEKISVLIVDDSALMRSIIGRIVESTPGLEIADKAMNGKFALQKLERAKPDVIVLDLEMPEMGGLEFLKERQRLGIDIPVIILSSIATQGAHVTIQCLEAGAVDFITKPNGSDASNIKTVGDELVERLFAYGGRYKQKKSAGEANKLPDNLAQKYRVDTESIYRAAMPLFSPQQPKKPEPVVPLLQPGTLEVIGIGISTGGPNALRQVFAELSGDIRQPILVVQHMPPGFTYEFANSLNKICQLEVKEASDGDLLKPGRILIAPGGKHMIIERRSLASIVRITETPPENGHRPSVDVLFNSIAENYKNHALGVIMTGMGKDGAKATLELYRQGSRTLGQDEASSVVYGMPRVAFEMGGVMEQVSLDNMASAINHYALGNA
jgi:chemotaxis response regulator protein-glutamate methylesterase